APLDLIRGAPLSYRRHRRSLDHASPEPAPPAYVRIRRSSFPSPRLRYLEASPLYAAAPSSETLQSIPSDPHRPIPGSRIPQQLRSRLVAEPSRRRNAHQYHPTFEALGRPTSEPYSSVPPQAYLTPAGRSSCPR